MRSYIRKVAVILAIPAVILGGGAFALASSSGSTPVTFYGCVNTVGTPNRTISNVHEKPVTCKTGSFAIHWNQVGPAGPQGPQGPQGSPGSDAIISVSASTSVTNWPESGGWATDNFTRLVTITRQHAAQASDCGATATQCWFYTETISDNGSFVPTDGHASPNGSSSDTITAANIGTTTMNGGGKLEFYASSDTPNPALVPGTADGSAKPSSTTSWYKLFFPVGTSFGLTNGASAPWITYDWNYTAAVSYTVSSTQVTCAQAWNDGINPGDDGQGSGDGNITGICPVI